ncbi:MAG TPA: hypothetical protein VNM90_10240 [Haliangium sp.]|nr:hypothetical protein [Haliangium sp.]
MSYVLDEETSTARDERRQPVNRLSTPVARVVSRVWVTSGMRLEIGNASHQSRYHARFVSMISPTDRASGVWLGMK